MGFISNALTVNAILQPKLPFDRSDIVPVTRLLNIPLIMVVPPSMPVNSVMNWWRSPSPSLANSTTHPGTAGPHASDGMVQTRERHRHRAITYKGVGSFRGAGRRRIQVMLTGPTAACRT